MSTITLILVLTISATFIGLPAVNAVDIQTYPALSVAPNPVQVNHDVQITIWISPIVPTQSEVFHNFTVTITEPDGTIDVLGPMDSFVMGAMNIIYKPDTVGTYKFKFNYPGQTVSTGDFYIPAESPITDLIVQQDPLPALPQTPISNDYWERPISSEERGWASISGNWAMIGYNSTYRMMYGDPAGFNPNTQAPRSAHIMWTKELDTGGLVGGEAGPFGYYTGQTYDPYFAPPAIWNGRLYYRQGNSRATRQGRQTGVVCVDLRTGEEIWRNEDAQISLIQATYEDGFSGQGYLPFIWDTEGSTWEVFDAFNGDLMYTFENALSGTAYVNGWWQDVVTFNEDGTFNVFILNGADNWFAKWSSDEAFFGRLKSDSIPKTGDWMDGIVWNVSIPARQAQDPTNRTKGPDVQAVTGNVLIAKVTDGNQWVEREIGYSLETGAELWVNEDPVMSWFNTAGEGVYASFHFGTRTWTAYDANTGTKLWTSDPYDYPWGQYTSYSMAIAYGKLYAGSFDGYMHAFDLATGKEVWRGGGRVNPQVGTGIWPMWSGPIIGGNVVFSGTGEETPSQPLTLGNKVFAFDAETGEELWNIAGYMSLKAIADGYLVGFNGYDNRIYCFGKGPSAMTVEGPKTAVPKGTAVMITGTITDQSTETKGTPAIADEDMSEWMEYLVMQKPMPEDAKGVPVKLAYMNADGSWTDIGETTSDNAGSFGYLWTPPDEGTYLVKAFFLGSDSYGSSYSTTYVGVGPAPTPSTPIEPEEPAAAFITTEIAIILAVIAVAVIGIVGYLVLKKRK